MHACMHTYANAYSTIQAKARNVATTEKCPANANVNKRLSQGTIKDKINDQFIHK